MSKFKCYNCKKYTEYLNSIPFLIALNNSIIYCTKCYDDIQLKYYNDILSKLNYKQLLILISVLILIFYIYYCV